MRLKHYYVFMFALLQLGAFNISAEENDTFSIIHSDNRPLVISISADSPPFSMVLPNGTPKGLYVEFWQLWSRYSGKAVVFKKGSLDSIAGELKRGDVDFHSGLFKNSQRKMWADFSIPFHSVETGLYLLRENSGEFTLEELNGQVDHKVAVRQGSFQAAYLSETYPNLKLVLYTDVENMFELLLNQYIHAIVGEIPHMKSKIAGKGYQGLFKLGKQRVLINNVHAVVRRGNLRLLEKINKGIKLIPVNEIVELEKKWLPELKTFFSLSSSLKGITHEQQEWIKSLGELKLGIDLVWKPYDFVDSDGVHSGLSAEYVQYIRDTLFLDLQPQLNTPWGEAFEQIKKGEIDLISAVVRTEEREKDLYFTEPYISFPSAIAIYRDSIYVTGIESLQGKRVGVQGGYIFEEVYRTRHPEIELVTFEEVYEGLESLQSGEIDAYIGALSSVNHHIMSRQMTNISVAAFSPYDLELSIGVRKGLEPIIPILNRVLAEMPSKQKARIASAWLTSQASDSDHLMGILLWVVLIAAVLLLITLYIFRANRLLQSEISVRKKFEISLENAKMKADAANQAKDEFLANMSHEVRTPMNAVVGMANLMSETKLTGEQLSYNQAIQNSAASLLVIINDILDLSKIEAGKLELETRPLNLQKLIDNVRDQVKLDLENKQLYLSVDIGAGIPDVIYGDAIRLGQVLLNLINNAVKFTNEGGIYLKVEMLPEKKGLLGLKFCISDTGIGMTIEEQKSLFKTYGQADSSTTRKYGGTGLGLTICKKLCKLMKGDIWVFSSKGGGSQFYFSCFFDNTIEQSSKTLNTLSNKDNSMLQLQQQLEGVSLLLVDDNDINIMIASKMLIKVGIKVVTANNGLQAVEILKQQTFDAVLMDIQMPIMDGYQATKVIRSELKLKELPIIAVTANVMNADISKAKAAGMNAHLGKPINLEKMLQALVVQIKR